MIRYLYVNSRAWPAGCVISDPMSPPPIAEEIDLHVIDLKSLREERRSLRAHRAFTPNDECFFIFLDVSRDFVARWVTDCVLSAKIFYLSDETLARPVFTINLPILSNREVILKQWEISSHNFTAHVVVEYLKTFFLAAEGF